MRKPYLLALIVLSMSIFRSFGQERNPKVIPCFADQVRAEQIRKNPALQQSIDSMDVAIEHFVKNHKKPNGGVVKGLNDKVLIPVVITIVHQNGAENITDMQAISQINALNTYYDAYGIQFCLATKKGSTSLTSISTPAGISSVTPGIFHYYSPGLTNHDVTQTGALMNVGAAFPANQYLRIFVVKSISSSSLPPGSIIQGYSSLPNNTYYSTDGIVMDYRAFGDIASCGCSTLASYSQLGRITVHEVGHYLGLYHTFEGGCAGMTAGTCSAQGDHVCDTPPVALPGNIGCPPAGWNTCNETPNLPDDIHNYMDYVDEGCMTGFTPGQSDRMDASIVMYRGDLVSSDNLVYTGISCGGQVMAHFTANTYAICTGGSITFTANPVPGATYAWNFGDGGTGSGATVSHTYSTAYAPATVTLTVTSGANSETNSSNVYVSACSPLSGTASTWMFSNKAGLNFASGVPLYDNSAELNNTMMGNVENVTTQCDASGNLLFYSNGNSIWDKNHLALTNALLADNSSATGAISIPKPGTTNQYYLFNTSVSEGLTYSILTMTGTQAAITSLNNTVPAPPGGYLLQNSTLWSGEGVTAIPSCNNEYWLLMHARISEAQHFLLVFKVTAAGITFHSDHLLPGFDGYFCTMEASPDGTKVMLSEFIGNSMLLCEFNPALGIVSNVTTINRKWIYGASFSSDSKLFYGIQEGTGDIFQYDVNASNILASEILIGNTGSYNPQKRLGMQMGPDNKLYLSRNLTRLGVIHAPNIRSTVAQPNLCLFEQNGPVLNTLTSGCGLPNNIDAKFTQIFTSDTLYAVEKRCDTYLFSSNICASSYSWNFGDPASGSANTASVMSPQHVFSGPGTYTVTVTAGGVTLTQTIVVPPNCAPCACELNGAFNYSVDGCTVSLEVQQYPDPCLQNVTYNWTFGDGNTATGAAVNYTYPSSGVRTICLTVTASSGTESCSAEGCKPITTECPEQPCDCRLMKPDFKYSVDEETCTYTFEGVHGGPRCLDDVVQYFWDYGDGMTSTLQNPIHIYTAPGSYEVCLRVRVLNSKGDVVCEDKYCEKIEVRCAGHCECKLKPKFTFSLDEKDCVYTFKGFHGGPDCLQFVEYLWKFGDGTQSIGQTTGHVFPGPGTYNVCLYVIVKDEKGKKICEDKYCQKVEVKCEGRCDCKLEPTFELTSLASCKIQFTGFSGSPCLNITGMYWYVNGVQVAASQTLVQQFDVNTSYEICFVVIGETQDGQKCEERYCQEYFFTDCYPEIKSLGSNQPKWKLFPNPASESFSIQLLDETPSATHVTLKSADGKIVGSYDYAADQRELVIAVPASVATGFLFVEVRSGEFTFTEKLMILH